MFVRSIVFGFSLVMLAGCVGSGLTKQQKVDMTVYQNEIKAACQNSPSMTQKYSTKDVTTLCNSRAERAVDSMETYYLLYNEDKLISTCENENKSLETECLHKYQNRYYSSETDHFINKTYSQ
ncbi:hypothetical protein [Marinomonas sp. THO17]|uniref:hypothetical protein n=1 Tax=Marinomonas sp. THO17 TaxID=3149048 RepID=UPI00336BC910